MNISDPRTALEALLSGEGVSRVEPSILLPADPYFDLAGEEFGQRLLLTTGADGIEYCLRPDFTLPIAQAYLKQGTERRAAAYAYLGRVFRQRTSGPAEFNQAGLELIGQANGEASLDRVLRFAADAINAYGFSDFRTVFGSVELFESFLNQVEMPEVWRPRIRHRFGHPLALTRLLDRLADRNGETQTISATRTELIEQTATALLEAGMSLNDSRSPEEIVDRLLEKQALAAAEVPATTITLLREYLALSGELEPTLQAVDFLATAHSIDITRPIGRLRRHSAVLKRNTVRFEASFSPRLDYYTGTVFEMMSTRDKILASGGQYDRLMEHLGAPEPITASGCAIWVDRLAREAFQ